MDLMNYKPEKPFAQRHLLTLQDWSADEILQTLSLALQLKAKQKAGEPHPLLAGKSLAMIFTKSSTRTRVSFEVGMQQLGGHALFLSSKDIQLGRGEPIGDTAKVLSRYVDGIMIRTFEQSDVVELARYGSIPVINGLTDRFHPCQVLADLMTFYEHKGELKGRKLAFIGDAANNMGHSLLIGCSKLGVNVALGCPKGYRPESEIVEWAKANAQAMGSDVLITDKLEDAVAGEALMAKADPKAIFLHCLPAHRGEEVTSGVIDGPQSVVFDQAENRLHAQKAVMALLMK